MTQKVGPRWLESRSLAAGESFHGGRTADSTRRRPARDSSARLWKTAVIGKRYPQSRLWGIPSRPIICWGGVMDFGAALILTDRLSSWQQEKLRRRDTHGESKLIKLAKGAYVLSKDWRRLTPKQRLFLRVAALQHAVPGGVLTGQAAALAMGLSTWSGPGQMRIDLYLPEGRRPRRLPGVRLHRPKTGGTFPTSVTTVAGMPVRVVSPVRAALDAARFDGAAAGLVPLENAWHEGRLTGHDLDVQLDLLAGTPGMPYARKAREIATPYGESPAESISALHIAAVGLPAPLRQVSIFDGDGVFIGRVDFFFPDVGMILEYEGAAKTTGAEGRNTALRELHRSRGFHNLGMVLRHLDAETLRDPSALLGVKDLHRALQVRGRPVDRRFWAPPPSPEQWDRGVRYPTGSGSRHLPPNLRDCA